MVAAEQQRRHALFQRLDDGLGGARAGIGNLLEVAGVFIAGGLGFGNLDADVAAVGDLVAKRLKTRLKAGDAHCRGAHVYAAAAGAQVERNADDADAARGLALRAAARKGEDGNSGGMGHAKIS